MPFEFLPSKRRITVPAAGHTSEIGGALATFTGASAAAPFGAAALLRLRALAVDVVADAAPAGGATRSTWPTSIASGFDKLFQRVMLDTDCRLSRAIFVSVSPRSTR
jgi:hypothetical protein